MTAEASCKFGLLNTIVTVKRASSVSGLKRDSLEWTPDELDVASKSKRGTWFSRRNHHTGL